MIRTCGFVKYARVSFLSFVFVIKFHFKIDLYVSKSSYTYRKKFYHSLIGDAKI